MTDDDIDEFLKDKCIDLNYLYNDKLRRLQIDGPAELTTKQNIAYALRYQGKFYFFVGRYEQALEYLTKLLEFEPNDSFSLKYRAESYCIMKRYEESLMDLGKLLEINMNVTWVIKAYEEVARK